MDRRGFFKRAAGAGALVVVAPMALAEEGQEQKPDEKPKRPMFKPNLELPFNGKTVKVDMDWISHDGQITVGLLAQLDAQFHPGHWDNVPPYTLMRSDDEVINPLLDHLAAHGISREMVNRVVEHAMDERKKALERTQEAQRRGVVNPPEAGKG